MILFLTAEINDAKVRSLCPQTMPKETLSSRLDPERLCFQDLLRYDPLTPEQTEDFLNRVIAGREAARFPSNNGFESPEKQEEYQQVLLAAKMAKERLILHNLRFVYHVAERYKDQGVPLTDLFTEGTIGLFIAIDRYDPAEAVDPNDPSKKATFLTYAGHWVRKLIQNYIDKDSGAIHFSQRQKYLLREIRRIADLRIKTSGGKPTDEEIARKTGLMVGRVRELLAQDQTIISLNQIVDEKSGSELGELIKDETSSFPDESVDQLGLEMALADVLQVLPPREVKVLQMRFGLIDGKTYTLREIGEMMPVTVSPERVRQIREKALARLREPHRASKLRTFYDGEEE